MKVQWLHLLVPSLVGREVASFHCLHFICGERRFIPQSTAMDDQSPNLLKQPKGLASFRLENDPLWGCSSGCDKKNWVMFQYVSVKAPLSSRERARVIAWSVILFCIKELSHQSLTCLTFSLYLDWSVFKQTGIKWRFRLVGMGHDLGHSSRGFFLLLNRV